jgi:hypothetical protein
MQRCCGPRFHCHLVFVISFLSLLPDPAVRCADLVAHSSPIWPASAFDERFSKPVPDSDWRSLLHGLNRQGPLSSPHRLFQVLRLRGGSTRDEIERRMREERERELAKEAEIKERQEKRRLEKEYAEQRQLAAIEEEDTKAGALVQRQRKLPEVMTLESLRTYAMELLAEGNIEKAVDALERVLGVDPFDTQALFALAQIMHDTR